MKPLLFLLSFVALWQWEADFDKALQKARDEHKLVLLNFSGSDWCGPCIAFRKDYLESAAFATYADAHLVLVNADFPRKSKNQPAADIVKRNEMLAEKYNKEGTFPLTLLLDSNGKVLKRWAGKPSEKPDDWINELANVDTKR
ncbi:MULTISPECIES: thioredoxin family protein [unclassified Flavobacterium]|uniref:thioredoxin family protein n=1 Tax=unclassified Flavobacterium TaxID=196869 RepID=UPI001F12B52D|nr:MULTISPECIES: thioredoxin family protein [unclassified Flavobacterium]UMY64731.1 thioredoxin family protein [Flavobacterium sp. HJ-32-4]